MAQVINIGTLVSTTIRPYYSDDPFPTVLSNDTLGGIHLIQSKTVGIGFDEIIPNRRQWGMLVFVYDEQKYYQLVPRNTGTPDVSRNINWVEYTGGSVASLEWVDSVKGIYGDNGLISPSPVTGDRFLVGSVAAGQFNGYKNQIAVFAEYLNNFGGGYIFTEPTNGCTLRVDNEPGVLYTFLGTSSLTGNWYKERQNTVRYIYPTSNNGLTFSYTTTTGQTPLMGYTYCVFYASFGTSNSGTVSLSIDGNFYAPIQKVSSNVLTDLSSGDFGSGVEYQLTYDNGVFQIFLPSASQGGTIGQAEDGDYDDGLFTDFTPSTPIGTPIDRFNEILKALVPPPAPDLNSWSVTNTSQFVSGKVSYTDAEAASPLGYVNTNLSPIGDVNQGGLYQFGAGNGYRLGVTSKNTGATTISGILNSGVSANPNLPTPAYGTYSIGSGITGSIVLYLNSSTISSVDLASTYGSINTTGGANGGLSLSAATASKFSNGSPFETFWYRTGTYMVKKSSGFMNNGFNQITVKHILPSTTITLTSYEFLADDSTTNTVYGISPNFTPNFSLVNTKYLSGIRYYTSGSFIYSVPVDNVYRNTYYPDTDAVIFSDVSSGGTSSIYNGQSYTTNTSSNQVFTPGSQQSLPQPSSVNQQLNASTTFTLANNTSYRKINGTSVVNVSVKRTVQGNTTGGALTKTGWYIDTYAATSTPLLESFNDESYRLQNLNFDTVSSISGGAWVSSSSLLTVYQNALQIADGRLLYPFANFSIGDSQLNPNFGSASTIYTTCKSSVVGAIYGGVSGHYRTYTRWFNLGSTSYAKFSLVVNHFGTTFVPVGTSLNNNSNCYLEFKLPYNGTNLPTGGLINGSVTGWLDASKDFSSQVTLSDGAGCRGQSQNPISGATWSINFGQRETGNSSGRVLMRITAGKDWTGYIETITLSTP